MVFETQDGSPSGQGSGSGDMLKTVYDIDLNNIADNSELLNGQIPSYYLDRQNHTNLQSISTLSDLQQQQITFFANGYYRISNDIETYIAKKAMAISQVLLYRRIAGSSGTTEIDIKIDGISIFLPANRPKVLFSDGNDAISTIIPNTINIPINGKVSLDILSIENGSPQDVSVEVIL